MKSIVVSIGSELLGGFLTDTNATFLAQEMSAAGIELVGVMQVGDDLQRIVQTLERATADAELTVITGGVGPTEDDLTREAIAKFVGEEVRVDPDQLKIVERFFAGRGIPMPSRNEKQAWLIPSSESIPNPVGTAPGWFVRHQGKIIVSMPGVPREMRRMWREQIMPRLADRLGGTAIVSATVKTIGIGESAAEDLVSDIIHRGHPVVATYAKNDGVHIRVSASDADREKASTLVDATVDEIRELFGPHAYGDLDISLGSAILQQCARIGLPLSVVEAGSAGRIANMLAEETDLQDWFAGGRIMSWSSATQLAASNQTVPTEPIDVARSIISSNLGSCTRTAKLGIAVRLDEFLDGERRVGQIAFVLDIDGEGFQRTHRVEANPNEVRRRAALWASEFLHVTLSTHPNSGC